jgi:hypothetical protein
VSDSDPDRTHSAATVLRALSEIKTPTAFPNLAALRLGRHCSALVEAECSVRHKNSVSRSGKLIGKCIKFEKFRLGVFDALGSDID